MPISKAAKSITWPAAQPNGIVSAGGVLTSEAISIAVDEVSGDFICLASSGAADSGYNIKFYLLGSVDGTNYTSEQEESGLLLAILNLAAVSTTYRSKPINRPLGLEHYKIYAVSDNAGTDSTTVDVELKALNLE